MSKDIQSEEFSSGKIIFYSLSFLVFLLIIRHLSEFKTVGILFKSVNPIWLALAVVSQFFTYVSLSLAYKSLVKIDEAKHKIKFGKFLRFTFLSVFLNHTLPSGGLSGNLFMFKSFVSAGVSKAVSASIVVVESISMYIVYLLFIFGVLGTFIIFSNHTAPHYFSIALFVGVIFYSVLALVVTYLGRGEKLFVFTRKISNLPGLKFLLQKLDYFPEGSLHLQNPWKIMFQRKALTLNALFLQLLLFLFDVFTVFALFHGLGITISFIKVLIAFIPTAIVGGLPISPGSLFVYETGMTIFYTSLGFPLEVAITVTLLYRALSFWLTIPIGLFVYKKHKFQSK